MKKHALILAWEYDGYHSLSGAALSRRVRQVAEGFQQNGWAVTVIHKDQRGECGEEPYCIHTEATEIRRIVVRSEKNIQSYSKIALLRKIQTFYYVTFHGDRSYDWANEVVQHYDTMGVSEPDLILAFFTPRGPLFLGNYLAAKLGTKWIADLQDNYDHGISRVMLPENKHWTRKILRSATAIVHVSTEWAKKDGATLGLHIDVIRHAIPDTGYKETGKYKPGATFKIFYGGSLSEHDQSLTVLKDTLNSMGELAKPIEIMVAGTQQTYDAFSRALSHVITVKQLGWLNREEYNQHIANSDCTLVIPWSSGTRQVVPSKFYELCSFGKPIWIVGNDTGGFAYLLEEWEHPAIATDNIEHQKKALSAAMNGDMSLMFCIEQCKAKPVMEHDLYHKYIELLR